MLKDLAENKPDVIIMNELHQRVMIAVHAYKILKPKTKIILLNHCYPYLTDFPVPENSVLFEWCSEDGAKDINDFLRNGVDHIINLNHRPKEKEIHSVLKERVIEKYFPIEDDFRIYIYNDAGGELMYRYPFGANYDSRMNLAVGSAFGDPDKEIMISSSGQGRIMVFNYYGLTINNGFYPLGENNKTGYSLAIGNVDGGERGENILAFKNGNTDEVMIYDFRFTKLLKRFIIGYGAKDVMVASGDLTGDGIDEIIVGLVVDGKTVVKTFNFNGNKLAEFSVQTGFGGDLSGLATLDVDFDGKKDIVFMSR